MKILYITHYGLAPKSFYCDAKTGKPKKVIGDGGTNIHVHLIGYFLKKGIKIFFSTFEKNYQYQAFFGKNKNFKIVSFWAPQSWLGRYNCFLDNIYKIFVLPLKSFLVETDYDFLVSTTDFLPDVIYSILIKIRNPKIKWVASYFLEAPQPWAKDNPYKTSLPRYLTGVLYWLVQRPSFWLIKWKANFVLVTSEPDVAKFITEERRKEKIVVVQGGVDIGEAKKYLGKKKIVQVEMRKYDACFIGRFHYQKGVLELVDIWKRVCQKKPRARLAMIGNGPLEVEVEKKIKTLRLGKNIELLGFRDGQEKFQIFKESKIMVHPATYDSGGMAPAEGMAWGLPGVSFNLQALKTYYPQGMVKTPRGDLEGFAKNILKLLEEKSYYRKMAKEAVKLTCDVWDWNVRVDGVYQKLFVK